MYGATILILCLAGTAGDVLPSQSPLALSVAGINNTTVPRYGLCELTLRLSATYDNPFDPGDIDVWGMFTPPEGPPIRVNAYLDQDFTHKLEGDHEVDAASGEPVWKIRFAPRLLGRWHYQVFAKDRTGYVQTGPATFRAVRSDDPGFVKAAGNPARYFAFENGQPFFAVGENMCWAGKRGTFDYEDWLPALSRAGGNWIRLWMISWNCGIEWTGDGYFGAGRYNLMTASRLDRIFDLAAQNAVQVMLCLGTYGEFTTGGYFNEGQWNANPYNVANGGPCAQPADFWANEQARKLYQRRLRYLAARYGWRANLCAWEFWNEAIEPAAWVAEMAAYLKGTDAFGHLVSTTYGDKDVWKIPNVDFTMTHHYGQGDVADSSPVIHFDARNHDAYAKPHLMAEFGIDWRNSDNPYDPQFKGVNLHNGLWASACSGNAGGAMIWYWDGYVHPGNLYATFTPLRTFADKTPWTHGRWRRLRIDAPRVPAGDETFRDLIIAPSCGWKRCPTEEFTLKADSVPDPTTFPSFIYAPVKSDIRTRPVFHLHCERPCQFIVHVDSVSHSACLQFLLDGQLARTIALSACPPTDSNVKPEFEKTDFRNEYGLYQAIFNKDYAIDIPVGEHAVQLEVTDGDWLSVGNYRVTNYTSSRYVNLQCYGMTNGNTAVLWLHNADHNWKNVRDGNPIPTIANAETTIHGLNPGRYTIEWWDTWQGRIDQRVPSAATQTGLGIAMPPIEKDIAARIVPR